MNAESVCRDDDDRAREPGPRGGGAQPVDDQSLRIDGVEQLALALKPLDGDDEQHVQQSLRLPHITTFIDLVTTAPTTITRHSRP